MPNQDDRSWPQTMPRWYQKKPDQLERAAARGDGGPQRPVEPGGGGPGLPGA